MLQENQTPQRLMAVPLNPHEFFNPEDVPKAPLGSTGVLGMGPEVRPGVEGGCLLIPDSIFLGHFFHIEAVLRQI